MRPLLLILFVLCTPTTIARAGDLQPKGTVTQSADGRVLIAQPDCGAASATYVPGVGVDGSAVAPADLPRPAAAVKPETAPIEIDSRLAKQFGAGVPGARIGRQVLGQVTVRDGRAYFNGQPLAPEASAAVMEGCQPGK